MLSETTRVRLGERHRNKLQQLCSKTGLNTSAILRLLIDSADLEVKAHFSVENKNAVQLSQGGNGVFVDATN